MPNTAKPLPVDSHERSSTISLPHPQGRVIMTLDRSSPPDRSAPTPAAPENAPPSPDPVHAACRVHGRLMWDRALPLGPGNAFERECCAVAFLDAGHAIPAQYGQAARDLSRLASKNPRVAAAWKRLAEATGLGLDELADLSLLEACAVLVDARNLRDRDTLLAAGSPAVAAEFYAPCTKCGAPVDLRGDVAHGSCCK